ncbi:MAG TPA: hemolysin III family protein [Rhodocyclaceae bacterium]|nr:hemolysin III family protein [Rhodocyclaceae bacterium]
MMERAQSLGEEIANSASHGLGLAAALAALPILIVAAARAGSAVNIAAASIFATTMVLLYLSSTLYHAIPRNRFKKLFQKLDHGAIYLLIAGTYTPFTLGVLHGAWGWTLFGLVWGLAGIGLILKLFDRLSHPLVSAGLYLVMGWLVLIAIRPLTTLLPSSGLIWLVAGGLAYTVGVAFYLADSRLRYSHFVWHLFVIAGTTCHFFAVLWYAA